MIGNKKFAFLNTFKFIALSLILALSCVGIYYAGISPSSDAPLTIAANEDYAYRDSIFNAPKAELESEQVELSSRIANLTPLSTAFAEDIASWMAVDGTIAPLNSADDVEGSGTINSPYIIKTVRGWIWFYYKATYPINDAVYTYAALNNDIDFQGYGYDLGVNVNGEQVTVFNGFYGSLDGRKHSLNNLSITGLTGIMQDVPQMGFSCGLFNGYGVKDFVAVSDDMPMFMPTTYLDENQTVIKNLNLPNSVTTQISLTSMYLTSVLGDVVYNTQIENVYVNNFFMSGVDVTGLNGYALAIDYGKSSILNSRFNFRGSKGGMAVVGMSATTLPEASQDYPRLIKDCSLEIKYVMDITDQDYLFGGFYAMASNLTIENCTTRGYAFAGYSGCIVGKGCSINGFPSKINIVNCTNYVIYSGACSAGIVSSSTDELMSAIIEVFQFKINDTDLLETRITGCSNYGSFVFGVFSSLTLDDETFAAGICSGQLGDYLYVDDCQDCHVCKSYLQEDFAHLDEAAGMAISGLIVMYAGQNVGIYSTSKNIAITNLTVNYVERNSDPLAFGGHFAAVIATASQSFSLDGLSYVIDATSNATNVYILPYLDVAKSISITNIHADVKLGGVLMNIYGFKIHSTPNGYPNEENTLLVKNIQINVDANVHGYASSSDSLYEAVIIDFRVYHFDEVPNREICNIVENINITMQYSASENNPYEPSEVEHDVEFWERYCNEMDSDTGVFRLHVKYLDDEIIRNKFRLKEGSSFDPNEWFFDESINDSFPSLRGFFAIDPYIATQTSDEILQQIQSYQDTPSTAA